MIKALAFPVWDMFCLAVALAVAMRVFEPPSEKFWHDWFMDLPIWVTPTFSLLAISRTYVTVWTRARILDALTLLFTLQGGLFISVGIALIIDPSGGSKWLIRALVISALGHAAILASRMFYRCVEETVHFLKSNHAPQANLERVVLYGAGGRCQLFLKEYGFNDSGSFGGRQIVGLIDDEPTLHLKWVYGHIVMGGLEELPKIIPRHRITGIIITAGLKPESMSGVRELAKQQGVRLSEWSFQNRLLEPGSPGNGA
jgi:FlaA1/EpsC-like NDP-sugar epimerase